ncbi:MAG: hypothetical protein UX31_C0009G0011 [Candidatus Nomurabacteria bacterium GW2011_GWA1_46_11]|uniref:Uncharacterized protein n=1 Tax=Candidatus Nomurabacteria bacterium GW2011_GWA1_46_11 TaxID=1618732 RepID=A0A0G1QVU6_9BACT|nr:MAG: hypothetical protein UW69_C0004G0010 [Microgenomates group bacterium GW2011_GWA2_44_7]KKT77688.1 MAG: hypothetical protein UW73_C0014G0011 [Microgenomates group bacterium GW2011_GWB1_44_8]KKU21933.1 MAG: hypothetical protein UX31_C0009G0011 [Candidatus Nomurabacteria bacterium GW2011_GWA1_46_11]
MDSSTDSVASVIKRWVHPEDLSGSFIAGLECLQMAYIKGVEGLIWAARTPADFILEAALRLGNECGFASLRDGWEPPPINWREYDWVERLTGCGFWARIIIRAAWDKAMHMHEMMVETGQIEIAEEFLQIETELEKLLVECGGSCRERECSARGVELR